MIFYLRNTFDGYVKNLQECQRTALMLAARKGSLEIVNKLIQHGASVSLTNKVNPKIDVMLNNYALLVTTGHSVAKGLSHFI